MIGAIVPRQDNLGTKINLFMSFSFHYLNNCKLTKSIGSAVIRHLMPTNFTPGPYMIGAMVPRQDNLGVKVLFKMSFSFHHLNNVN
jgi:hypothetical protein